MILDNLENASAYFECVPQFEQFMKFFNENDLLNMPACKLRLAGDELIVNIVDFAGKAEQNCRMEAHNEYIHIQIPMNADETMGWKSAADCREVTTEYNEQKDVEFYGDKATAMLNVQAGQFAVFFPEDAHQPGIAEGKSYRKIIVKIKDTRN